MSLCLRGLILACCIAFSALSGGRTVGAQLMPAGPHVSPQAPMGTALVVACSPAKPVVEPHESVELMAFAISPDAQPLQYAWKTAEGGFAAEGIEPQRDVQGRTHLSLEAKGSLARWDPNGIQSGTYKLTVTVSGVHDVSAACSLEIVVAEEERGPDREAGRALLVRNRQERKGYGLYSYLLLGAPPGESTRERYRKAIQAYLSLILDVSQLERYFDRGRLNVTYLPVTSKPTRDTTVDWALEHYDYARARKLLSSVSGTYNEGPYIVSSFQPLHGAETLSSPYVFQDLSHVPPSVIEFWVRQFLNQAAQGRFWELRTVADLVLKLRTAIAVAAEGLPEVRKAVTTWVDLTPPK